MVAIPGRFLIHLDSIRHNQPNRQNSTTASHVTRNQPPHPNDRVIVKVNQRRAVNQQAIVSFNSNPLPVSWLKPSQSHPLSISLFHQLQAPPLELSFKNPPDIKISTSTNRNGTATEPQRNRNGTKPKVNRAGSELEAEGKRRRRAQRCHWWKLCRLISTPVSNWRALCSRITSDKVG